MNSCLYQRHLCIMECQQPHAECTSVYICYMMHRLLSFGDSYAPRQAGKSVCLHLHVCTHKQSLGWECADCLSLYKANSFLLYSLNMSILNRFFWLAREIASFDSQAAGIMPCKERSICICVLGSWGEVVGAFKEQSKVCSDCCKPASLLIGNLVFNLEVQIFAHPLFGA